MSPQTRRGRAAPPSHRKSASRGSAPTRKPAPPVEEFDDELDGAKPKKQVRRQPAPGRRQRGLARIRRTSFYRYTSDAVGAYLPLFAVFVVLLGGFWAWTSFGPHAPTPKQNWLALEEKWKPKRDADVKRVASAIAADDFNAMIAAYTSVRDDTRSWDGELSAVQNWDDPNVSPDPNQQSTATALVGQLIQDGVAEANLLDQVVAAKSSYDVLVLKPQVDQVDQGWLADYQAARQAIFGIQINPGQSLALPPGQACPTPAPTDTPGPTLAPGATATPSPTATATPTPTPSPSGSPVMCVSAPPASPSPGSSPTPTPTPTPTPAPTPTPTPTPTPKT